MATGASKALEPEGIAFSAPECLQPPLEVAPAGQRAMSSVRG
jgi:hypothetical protein